MITDHELVGFLEENNVSPLSGGDIGDGEYSLPAREWVLGTFSKALATLQETFGVTNWQAESNDCDDFARLVAAFGQILHNRTRAGKSSLAVGEFWYMRDTGEAHAINLFVIRQDPPNGPLAMLFYEPQLRQEISLSRKEMESCDTYRF